MGNNGVKNIILMVILVVLSFFLGIQASDGAKTPIMIISALVGIFGLLYLGKRSWWIMFLAEPLLPLLPPSLFLTNYAVTAAMICSGLLMYWLVMRVMGYVQIKWQGFFPLDFILGIFVIYMCITFYRRPVGIGFLGEYFENVGGIIYVVMIFVTLGYIARSIIPLTYETGTKLVKLLFRITFIAHVLILLKSLVEGHATIIEEAQSSRFAMLAPLSIFIFYYILASKSFIQIISSFKSSAILCFCVIGLLVSGWRSRLATFIVTVGGIVFLKREMCLYAIAASGAYGVLLFLSHEHILEELPFGMQRTLCAVPGHLNVKKSIRRDAEASSRWRKVMWRWAMDPRTHLINNYIIGDGPGDDKAAIHRSNLAVMRGTLQFGDQRTFAARGTWHSGWVTVIHRLGIVGLGIVIIAQLSGFVLIVIVYRAYEKTPLQKYVLPLLAPNIGNIAGFYISTGTLESFLIDMFSLNLAKILYVQARERGMVPNFFRQKTYIPMVIQDLEKQPAPTQTA